MDHPKTSSGASGGSKGTLAIVDDEPIIRARLGQLFTMDGYDVFAYAAGADLLAAPRLPHVDVVIMDLRMPGLSGIELLAHLKAIDASTEVIIMTGHGELQTSIQALRLGAFDYHTKPVDYDELEITVSRALEKQKLVATKAQALAALDQARRYAEGILANFLDALIVSGPDGRIQHANSAVLSLLGYEEHELVGQPIGIILGSEVHPWGTDSPVSASVREPIRNVELHYKTKCGNRIPMSCNASAMTNERGEVSGIVVAAKDIRGLKEREARLVAAYSDLERAHLELRNTQAQLVHAAKLAVLGQLGASIAHELNQPLTTIQLLVQTIMTVPTATVADRMSSLNAVVKSTHRMDRIINNVRNFSRKTDRLWERSDPVGPVRDALDLLSEQLKIHGIEVTAPAGGDLPAVMCDRMELQQVFLNLIANARDAVLLLPDGRRRSIAIDVEVSADAVIYRVVDSGLGVPAKLGARLFEPFSSSKPKGQGTGLGLAISRGIVEAHGGTLALGSSSEAGAVFVVKLPYRGSPLP